MKNLMKIDKWLSNYPAQAILIGFIYLISQYLPLWFYWGLGTYVGFWFYQVHKNKNYLKEVMGDKSPKKVLGLVKGFTTSSKESPLV